MLKIKGVGVGVRRDSKNTSVIYIYINVRRWMNVRCDIIPRKAKKLILDDYN